MVAARLGKLGEAERIPVAIERPDGRLVDALLEAGHPVLPAKPNAIKAWREAEVLSGAKSDPGDAGVIADYLRVRIHRLRPAAPLSGHTKAVRAMVRTRTDLVEARVAATNQLAAPLDSYWPGAKTNDLRQHRIGDRAGLPDQVPDRRVRGLADREAAGRLLRLLGQEPRRGAAGPPACRAGRRD